jgi:hypothetical protein
MPPRKIEELLDLKPGQPVSPAEQAMLNAYFMKPDEAERGILGTLYLATKGKINATAADIAALAEKEQKREKAEKELSKDIKSLVDQMKKQQGLK